MKLKSLIVLLLAGIWGVGGWWWYTCKVKGFCGADVTTAQVAAGTAAVGAATMSANENSDKTPAMAEGDIDTDGDGIPNAKEEMLGLDPTKEDSDGDGIADAIELARDQQDTDGDGIIDALDDDDDGDGILTADENPDPNGDGNINDADDTNANQVADYLEKSDKTATDTAGSGVTSGDADKAAAEKAEAEKAAAEKAAAEQAEADKAEAAKTAAEKEQADADKVTMETGTSSASNGSGIDPATLHFPTGSANTQLADDTKAYFEKVTNFLKENQSAKVTITGHTDDQGDAGKNKTLGLKRAEMIKQMLSDMGAPADRITASSDGEDKPVADNKTPEGRKKNRRVEVTPEK